MFVSKTLTLASRSKSGRACVIRRTATWNSERFPRIANVSTQSTSVTAGSFTRSKSAPPQLRGRSSPLGKAWRM